MNREDLLKIFNNKNSTLPPEELKAALEAAETFIKNSISLSPEKQFKDQEFASIYFEVIKRDIAEYKGKEEDKSNYFKEKHPDLFSFIKIGLALATETKDREKAIDQLKTMHELFSIVEYNDVNHLDVLRTLLRLLIDAHPNPTTDDEKTKEILKFAQELIRVSNLGKNYKSGNQSPEELIKDIRELKIKRKEIYEDQGLSVQGKLEKSTGLILPMAASIFASCVEEVFKEEKPNYSMEILGSFARGEGTPLSDIEYALVIGEGVDKEKMLEAAELFYNRVRNYGEAATDFTVSDMTLGFAVDETLRPNNKPGDIFLIGTVDELLFEINLRSTWGNVLSDIGPILQSDSISEAKAEAGTEIKSLHNDFDLKRREKLSGIEETSLKETEEGKGKRSNKEIQSQILSLMQENIKTSVRESVSLKDGDEVFKDNEYLKNLINFLNEYKSGKKPSHSFDVKELARAPAFLARYLELKYGLFCNNTDQLLINLQKEKKISPDQLQVLQRILEIARTFRLELQNEHNFDNHDAGGSKINKDNVAELLGLCIQLKKIIKIKTELDPLIESIEENLRVEQERLKKSINNHMTGNGDRKRRIDVIEDALKKLNELKPVSAENIRDFKKNLSNIISTLEEGMKPKARVQKGREFFARRKSKTVTNMIPDIKKINGDIEKIINNLDFVVKNEDKVKSELKEDDDSFVVVNEDEIEPGFKEGGDDFVMIENLKTAQESSTPEKDPLLSRIPTERPIEQNGKTLPTSSPFENKNNPNREGSRKDRYTPVSEDAITTPSQAEINRAKLQKIFTEGATQPSTPQEEVAGKKEKDQVATSNLLLPPTKAVTFRSPSTKDATQAAPASTNTAAPASTNTAAPAEPTNKSKNSPGK